MHLHYSITSSGASVGVGPGNCMGCLGFLATSQQTNGKSLPNNEVRSRGSRVAGVRTTVAQPAGRWPS